MPLPDDASTQIIIPQRLGPQNSSKNIFKNPHPGFLGMGCSFIRNPSGSHRHQADFASHPQQLAICDAVAWPPVTAVPRFFRPEMDGSKKGSQKDAEKVETSNIIMLRLTKIWMIHGSIIVMLIEYIHKSAQLCRSINVSNFRCVPWLKTEVSTG